MNKGLASPATQRVVSSHFQCSSELTLSPQALCCCVWLVPMRLYDGMVNTACLVRATRNIAANIVIAIFLSQELVPVPPSCNIHHLAILQDSHLCESYSSHELTWDELAWASLHQGKFTESLWPFRHLFWSPHPPRSTFGRSVYLDATLRLLIPMAADALSLLLRL